MFNLKTILRTSPKDRREYRKELIDYRVQKKLQAQQWAEINQNLAYANEQSAKRYRDLRSQYDRAFKKQEEQLAQAYAKETDKALTKQHQDLSEYYKQQNEFRNMREEAQKTKALAEKINFLGTNILDEIATKKAKEKERQKRRSSSRSRSRSSIYGGSTVTRAYSSSGARNLQSSALSNASISRRPTRSFLDRLLGR